jgi:hypothetical protein
MDFGPTSEIDLQAEYLRWFDYWLKGMQNGILEEPLIQVFCMFSNRWLKADAYPLPGTETIRMMLSSARGANTSLGDGKLLFGPPEGGKTFDQFIYDPGNPTPYPDYYIPEEEPKSSAAPALVDPQVPEEKKQAFHKAVTDSRNDILVFRSEPLPSAVHVVGPLSLVMYASTSAVDTDWMVSLMDENDKGGILHVSLGALRAQYRNSTKNAEPLKGNEICRYTIDLGQTGMRFSQGHRIRIEIASTFYPLFSRSLNKGGSNETGTKYVKATQRVYHSPAYPSCLLLPVIQPEKFQ